MKKNIAGMFLVVSCFMFVVGGCASNESVKKEELIVPTTKPTAQVKVGLSPDRLSVISYGKERPAVQGNVESAWSKNRRDEFVIHKQ